MELSELTAYAKEHYQAEEEHLWKDFPGFTVLRHPVTGKWAALLMRQWDSDSGRWIERADIKAGIGASGSTCPTCVASPTRMTGQNWAGLRLEECNEPRVVFDLLDRAFGKGMVSGHTIVIDHASGSEGTIAKDIPLPFAGRRQEMLPSESDPVRLREMRRLYRYDDGSFRSKCENFYRQARFMEDYEDDQPWDGSYRKYFTTYHDLNTTQLRGYFTWRTAVRNGDYQPIATSLAYIYLYELLNDIGVDGPEDALQKMEAFKNGFVDTGLASGSMDANLKRWMLEYAVLKDLPVETTLKYADESLIERDKALQILRKPEDHDDEEVCGALNLLSRRKRHIPFGKADTEKGHHLLAQIWRQAQQLSKNDPEDLFTSCFGRKTYHRWHPLANAVWFEKSPHEDIVYELDPVRRYKCSHGRWDEYTYAEIDFDKKRFTSFLREADRQIRLYLKTGHYLTKRTDESWIASRIEAILDEERTAEIEAAKPKIEIDLSGLEKIRQDAGETRDNLLTEEEKAPDRPQMTAVPVKKQVQPTALSEQKAPAASLLDELHLHVLRSLLHGESADQYMKDHFMMPSLAADTIDEALMDEVGDNVVAFDGSQLSLVDEYRDDVERLVGA